MSFEQDAEGGRDAGQRRRHDDGTKRGSWSAATAGTAVRAGLGLTFEGGLSMFPQLFMLGDVRLDWSMPPGHLLRFVRIEDDGDFTGMLVCVPSRVPGAIAWRPSPRGRRRRPSGREWFPPGSGGVAPPTLADIQAVLDDLAPEPTRASDLRWSSTFRVKHGIVDHYRVGSVFVAGDAAHLHPPAGGQGMNTGIQDAWNLGWKLALAVQDNAAPDLLDSYEAERRPAGRAIVDRAVSLAFTDEMDMEDEKAQFLLDMQMTTSYAGSALVGQDVAVEGALRGPAPGERAPDVHGLTAFGVGHDLRLFDLTRGTRSTLLLHADDSVDENGLVEAGALARTARPGPRARSTPS
ncbi:FAD-dependent monooxygenase [Rathayibacter oskolensis]|uniref:FAD-dependent monooxygenase n=1 Tax=Rathayibacter oskolensis TaxID=1891671 RepID=UPI0034657FA1